MLVLKMCVLMHILRAQISWTKCPRCATCTNCLFRHYSANCPFGNTHTEIARVEHIHTSVSHSDVPLYIASCVCVPMTYLLFNYTFLYFIVRYDPPHCMCWHAMLHRVFKMYWTTWIHHLSILLPAPSELSSYTPQAQQLVKPLLKTIREGLLDISTVMEKIAEVMLCKATAKKT